MIQSNTIFLKIFLFLHLIIYSLSQVDLSDYNYPQPGVSNNIIHVAIMGTNDIHGEIFPNRFQSPKNTFLYSGGATNIYSYAKAMREEYKDYFLWFDGGDQFQGTMECMLSEGNIMKDYYNHVNISGIAIGNHEFDYGIDKLKEHIKNEHFPTLCANLYDKSKKKYVWDGLWDNVKPYEIYTLGGKPKIRIGVIGLATAETIAFTSTDLSNYSFDNYYDITKNWTDYLRNVEKVDAVVLLTHFGPKCPQEPIEKMELKMRNKEFFQKECDPDQEIMDFLKKIQSEELKIDALIGAHVHDVVHHWIYDIPCIESSGAGFFNILYLPFEINNDGSVKIINDNIQIEGPVPVCEKVWEDNKNCIYKENEPASNMKEIIFHNHVLEKDKGLDNALEEWYKIIEPKMINTLVKSNAEISLNDEKETILTNLINDIGKSISGADICFYNLGGLRHSWHKGNITEIDVFKMFPFNNTWYKFEMTGEEVIRMFKELNSNVIYPASGLMQTYIKRNMKNVLRDIEFWDGIRKTKIDLKKTYTICTNDFLAEGGSGMGKIRKWYDLRNLEKCGVIRDTMVQYFKKMKVINEEFFIDPKNPNLIFLDNKE